MKSCYFCIPLFESESSQYYYFIIILIINSSYTTERIFLAFPGTNGSSFKVVPWYLCLFVHKNVWFVSYFKMQKKKKKKKKSNYDFFCCEFLVIMLLLVDDMTFVFLSWKGGWLWFTGSKETICDALRDLVPFVQFKKREKHLLRSVNFSSRLKPATLLKLTLVHGCFSRFSNCTDGTKSRNAPHILLSVHTASILTLKNILFPCKI